MAQITQTGTVHDVVVIGSGAGGGTVTKVLADLGVSVLLMEAGPMMSMSDLKEHMWPYDVPHRGAGPKGEAYSGGPTGFTYSANFGGAKLDGEPYTVAPGSDFSWFRSRMLGGRTNHYGRVTLRFADYDFKPRTRDGLGFDWPISYEDLAPYYDKAETVHRRHRQRREHPQRAGRHLRQAGAAARARHARAALVREARLSARCRRAGGHDSPRNGRPGVPLLRPVRPRLHDGVQLRLELRADLPGDEDGPRPGPRERDGARAHHGRDRQGHRGLLHRQDDGTEKQVRCRTVVLAASACESARLLLNSKSSRHPQGLANSSGIVGRYLMDTVGFGMSASVPALSGMPHYNSDGYGAHLYVPWWGWDKQQELGFPRGYHIEVGGGYGMPGIGSFKGIVNRTEGYGVKMKQAIRDEYGMSLNLAAAAR